MRDFAQSCGTAGRDGAAEAEPSQAAVPGDDAGARGGCGAGQEIAAWTSPGTFFSTRGLHFVSGHDPGHGSPPSGVAAPWKPMVGQRALNLPPFWENRTTFPSPLASARLREHD